MTAIVGILNKEAVAIAADSAVTYGSGKSINGANKLFVISCDPPVALSIYNDAEYLGMVWETVAKLFRDELTKLEPKEKVVDYQLELISFLEALGKRLDLETVIHFWAKIYFHFQEKLYADLEEENKLDSVEEEIERLLDLWKKSESLTVGLPSFEEFSNVMHHHKIDISITNNEGAPLFENQPKLLEIFYEYLLRFPYISSFSGISIAGFGVAELFPSVSSIHVFGFFFTHLVYREDKGNTTQISPLNRGYVVTYAQDDVIKTIITGIDPDMRSWILSESKKAFEGLQASIRNKIFKELPNLDNSSKETIKAICSAEMPDKILKIWNANLDKFQGENFLSPAFSTIAHLPKQDLADLAESWLHMTYLNRRMTDKHESVGGDIDVLLITKGDGAVWIKRKHYFDADKNFHFFAKKLASFLPNSSL